MISASLQFPQTHLADKNLFCVIPGLQRPSIDTAAVINLKADTNICEDSYIVHWLITQQQCWVVLDKKQTFS